jgi:hypothetical protein
VAFLTNQQTKGTVALRTLHGVIVNFVYPLLVIAGQPNAFGRNVMEKGEHVKLDRVSATHRPPTANAVRMSPADGACPSTSTMIG